MSSEYIALLFPIAVLYATPTLLALLRKHNNLRAILLLNLLLGWTLVGWVVSIVWASANPAIRDKEGAAPGTFRYLIPIVSFAVISGGLLYALVAVNSGKRDPSSVPSALIGKPAPEFALPAPAGFPQGLSTADLKGKVTILNVFASWCPPCHVEHPLLLDLAKEAKSGGFQLVGLNWKDKDEKLAAWFKEAGDPFSRIGADRSGRVGIDWGVYGAPETYILDRDAKIVYRFAGPLTKELLRNEIRPLLAKLRK